METELFDSVMLVEDPEKAKFELLRLESDIFDKRSIVTIDSSSEYSDYSKASSSHSRPPSGGSVHSNAKSKTPVTEPEDVKPSIRKSRQIADEKISKSSAQARASTSKKAGNKEADKNEDKCDYCNKKGFLVCCDSCEAAYHLECHTPALDSIPTGSFQCYQCHYRQYYKESPVEAPTPNSSYNDSYATECFMKELNTMRVVPFTLPDYVKAFVKDLPPIMPNEEFKRKFKRKKTDYFNNCYVCDRPVTVRNSNQCQFCSNTIHLDCDPQPSCSTRLYAWRCNLHVENYLDTYMLDSTSTYKRLKLWNRHSDSKMDQTQTEHTFIKRLINNSKNAQTLEAAQTMLDLKNSLAKSPSQIEKQKCILPSIPFDVSMLYSDIFTQNSKAIAAFFPAFETSAIRPVVYDGRSLSIGLSKACMFQLSSVPFECKAMSSRQLVLQQKQGLHYLSAGIGGLTRVDSTFLGERPPRFPRDLCLCTQKIDEEPTPNISSHMAVFSHKVYSVQLGCARFYLVFSPLMLGSKSLAVR